VVPKFYPRNLLLSLKAALNPDVIIVWWYEKEMGNPINNFGDVLNPVLVKYLSGREPIQASRIFNITNKPVYYVIGSVLEVAKGKRLVVWGAGFMYAEGRFRQRPEKVLAVRGPFSRQIILNLGIDCPEVYGDPTLLCPRFYKPKVSKTYRLWIVPHYFDKDNSCLAHLLSNPGVKLIDIQGGIYKVIDEINSCEFIVSSSLHGIIVADAYGIPSLWIRLSNKITGEDFKYKDYFASVGRETVDPLVITESTTLPEIYSHLQKYEIHIDMDKLLKACPFRHQNQNHRNLVGDKTRK